MTEYTFHKSNLMPGAPRMLPEPLLAAAFFMSTRTNMSRDIEVFLDEEAIPVHQRRNLWMTMIWDERKGDGAVAQAAYSWLDGQVVREAIFIHPDYAAMNFESFMNGMGSALFGALPIHTPQSVSAV